MSRTFAALSLFCVPSIAAAGDVGITVSDIGGADYASIADAIAGTSPDDAVHIRVLSGQFPSVIIHRAGVIQIESGGSADLVSIGAIDVNDVGADVTVRNIQITGGGARVSRGALTLEELSIVNADGSGRAAVEAAHDTNLTMDTVLVENWRGAQAPIIVEQNVNANLDTVGVFASEGSKAGGVWARNANLRISGLFTTDTTGIEGAGAVHIHGGKVQMDGSQFLRATGAMGGGLRMTGNAEVVAQDMVFAENSAPEGAHVRMESGTFELVRSTASEGSAERGGVFWQGGGTATIRNAAWDGNHALQAGAAVYQQAGVLEASFGTFTRMASGGAASAHTGSGTATYNGVIIAETEGPAFDISGDATTTFDDGLMWLVQANQAVYGNLSYEPNEAFQAPAFVRPVDGDYALRATSAGLDLGILGAADPDGTAADAGMYGGPDAWILDDLDGDGYVYGRDCADEDPEIHENAVDVFYDGIDSNCDGASDFDQDGDGFDANLLGGGDCDDTDPSIHPGAVESGGDKIDEDCDGFDYPDADADGWPANFDCDDTDSSVSPDAEDAWYDGIDQDCAGNDDFDQDGDGYQDTRYGGRDCDDTDPHRHPMYPDFAGDGIDQDCDGEDATVEQGTEDDVYSVRPDEGASLSPYAPEAMGDAPTNESATVATGCSSVSGTGGSWALGLLAVFGLIGRRRD